VLVLRNFNRFEVARFRDVRHFSQGPGVLFASLPCRLVILAAQIGEVGGPPRFGVVGRV